MKIEIFNKIIIIPFRFPKIYNVIDKVTGVGSNAKNEQHIIMLDIDEMPLGELIARIKVAQKEMELSDFHIIQSSKKGIHCYCLDKLSFGEVINVHRDYFSEESYLYDKFALKRGYWVLRITEKKGFKPKYLMTIKSNHNYWEKSNAHRVLLNKLHSNLEIEEDETYDLNEEVPIHTYRTVERKQKKEFMDIDEVIKT